MRDTGILNELREKATRLTMAFYRVSELFPADEPLRGHCREKADEILAGVTECGIGTEIEKEMARAGARIDTLQKYLLVADTMRWVARINIEVLAREYGSLKELVQAVPIEVIEEGGYIIEGADMDIMEDLDGPIAPAENEEKKDPADDFSQNFNNAKITHDNSHEPNGRQKMILEHLAQARQAKVSDFFSVLAGVSAKTIQRDLSELVNKNFLKREGEKRWTVYSLNNVS